MKERMLDGSDKEVSEGRMPSQVRQAIEFGTSNGCRVELFESKHFPGMTDVIIDKFGGNNSNHLVECFSFCIPFDYRTVLRTAANETRSSDLQSRRHSLVFDTPETSCFS